MKTREQLDMASIIDTTIQSYLQDRAITGATPFEELDPAAKARLRQAFAPVIWSAIPAILDQLKETPAVEVQDEDTLPAFVVPDTLEGLL